ncbi:Clp protease N-terminal domain-containing protein [Kitasatospora cineracea]|uniref:ClpA/ClpB-like protein n=1 Tax=Kitasatospora cineracea TaxID=88074 RepID=A0A8G1UN19_9ACTN|nr:Clp protease N-terminal domain-containing protein [Kitasatospora cineracea]ROR46815.1 ClpA/ClpB-like protein [Kitasatospora cineracea]
MSAFDRYLHALLLRAADEARQDGSPTTDAHHLLLALAADPAPESAAAVRRLLADAGLDRDGVRAALDREFAHSLHAVGISPEAHRLPRPTPGVEASRLGASAKLALERSFATARKKDQSAAHLLLGILRAEVGTVPRALALSGVDREQLIARATELTAHQ